MKRKTVSGITLSLLLIGMLILAFSIQPVEASGTIYIRADGSIEGTTDISTVDNITYTFTDNIYDEIVVERDNIVVDGAGYTLEGTGSGAGITMWGRSNVTIKNMEIKSFMHGIELIGSSNNTIYGNNITNCGTGIRLCSFSNYNSISGNSITNNDLGILFLESSNNKLRNNDASNNKYSFEVSGLSLSDYIQDIDNSNTVNGKPVYYWVNRRDMTVPLDAGYVALVKCTNITVQNLNLANNGQGVILAYTTNSRITENNMTNNHYGTWLIWSSNNAISGNNITANDNCGICLLWSSNNAISGNKITNNYYGIRLFVASFYNTISGNNITNNVYGIWLKYSSDTKFYHNNFVDNTRQVYSEESTNVWDDGYPSGGNYWSDHVCTGNPSDGSQPYIIDPDNIDHYPFQDPNGWLLQLTVTSSPITGIPFTINDTPKTTPYTEWLLSGSYTLIMPETHNGYVWSHWLEDGDTNRIKTILLQGTTWTAVYEPAPKPVGGKATPINIPISKPETPALWIWLSTIILSLVLAVVYVKKRKRQ